MKTVKELKEGDYIAFEYENDIIVSKITCITNDTFLSHFLIGYSSEGEWIDKQDVIAIGNSEGKGKIPHYFGNFDILLPNHKLLNKQ